MQTTIARTNTNNNIDLSKWRGAAQHIFVGEVCFVCRPKHLETRGKERKKHTRTTRKGVPMCQALLLPNRNPFMRESAAICGTVAAQCICCGPLIASRSPGWGLGINLYASDVLSVGAVLHIFPSHLFAALINLYIGTIRKRNTNTYVQKVLLLYVARNLCEHGRQNV